MTTNKDNLYDYLFSFNIHDNLWYAYRKDDHIHFFNGKLDTKEYFSDKDIQKLIDKVCKK